MPGEEFLTLAQRSDDDRLKFVSKTVRVENEISRPLLKGLDIVVKGGLGEGFELAILYDAVILLAIATKDNLQDPLL